MSLPITEKLIQRQINNWNRFREFLPEPQPAGQAPPPGPIITISRQAGSGGRLLATALAERLDLQVHDQSLVEKIVRDRNLEEELIADLDEAEINQARLWVRGVLNRKIFMKDQYHVALVKVVTALAARGNAIFLGRGAHLILGENASLRIRLVASRRNRQENLRARTGLSKAEVRTLLDETDRRRSEYIRRLFQEIPGQPEQFDLLINTDRFTTEDQVELVLLALLGQQAGKLRQTGQETVPQEQAARD